MPHFLPHPRPKVKQPSRNAEKTGNAGKAGKACGGNNSPRTPLFLPPGFAARQDKGGRENSCRAFFQRSGAPGDVRSPADGRKQAEFTSAVKRGGRRASLVSVQRVRSRRENVVLGHRKMSRHAGGIIPPAPPWFALRLRRAAGAVPGTEPGIRKGGRAEASGAKAGKARRALFGLQSQCRRARLRPPAAADRCSRFTVTSVLMEEISRFLRESVGSTLWEAFVERRQPLLKARAGRRLHRDKRLSTLWGPGPLSSGPAGGHE